MDLRTKLIFALVAVSLGSMFVFGALISTRVDAQLRERTLAQLDQLAESKREALHWIILGWHDRVDLIASRTQLRASVAEHVRTGSAAERVRIQQILEDALAASESVALLTVEDTAGSPIVSVRRGGEVDVIARGIVRGTQGVGAGPTSVEGAVPAAAPAAVPTATYAGAEFVVAGPPRVIFRAALQNEGAKLGDLVVTFEARELIELTGQEPGLGETGEALVVTLDERGIPRTLHPTRHTDGGGAGVVLPDGPAGLAAHALQFGSAQVREGVVDYRGAVVWAATRFVPETGWGLILKVDEVEQVAPYEEFAQWLRQTALILSAFAILAGFVLGLRFAHPIHELSEVADRIRKGEMSARAKVMREDEVGVLARTFNQMAGEIEEQMALLHEFRKFFDVSVDMMCIAGTDGYFKRTNPAFRRELGWSDEELLSKPFYDLVHPDDLARTQAEVAKLARGIPTISFQNRFLCADGRYKRLRWATHPELETGKLYAIAHVVDGASPA